jgi:hypothetical protein
VWDEVAFFPRALPTAMLPAPLQGAAGRKQTSGMHSLRGCAPLGWAAEVSTVATAYDALYNSVKARQDLNRNLRLNNLHRRLARGRHTRGVRTDQDKPAPDYAQHSN